jgi:hypothetical protein
MEAESLSSTLAGAVATQSPQSSQSAAKRLNRPRSAVPLRERDTALSTVHACSGLRDGGGIFNRGGLGLVDDATRGWRGAGPYVAQTRSRVGSTASSVVHTTSPATISTPKANTMRKRREDGAAARPARGPLRVRLRARRCHSPGAAGESAPWRSWGAANQYASGGGMNDGAQNVSARVGTQQRPRLMLEHATGRLAESQITTGCHGSLTRREIVRLCACWRVRRRIAFLAYTCRGASASPVTCSRRVQV